MRKHGDRHRYRPLPWRVLGALLMKDDPMLGTVILELEEARSKLNAKIERAMGMCSSGGGSGSIRPYSHASARSRSPDPKSETAFEFLEAVRQTFGQLIAEEL